MFLMSWWVPKAYVNMMYLMLVRIAVDDIFLSEIC